MVHYIAERFRSGLRRDPGAYPGLARRHPPGRRGDGARVRPSAGREARDAAALRERRVGDLLDARPARAPVQAGDPARPGDGRRDPRPHRGGDRPGARRRAGGGGGDERVRGRASDPPGAPRARTMLARARWAATALRRPTTASGRSGWSTRSPKRHTKTPKGLLWRRSRRPAWASPSTSGARTRRARAGSPSATSASDYVDAQVDAEAKIVAVPKPAGVVLALTPSTNPIATVYFKVLLALMTRNAVVVSPHPLARRTCVDAVQLLAARGGRGGRARRLPAGRRGADDPADRGADGRPRRRRDRRHRRHRGRARGLPLAATRRSASGPATCRRWSTPPPTSRRRRSCLADSKAFDNSILCTNESVAIVEERVADAFVRELGAQRRARARRGGGAARPRRAVSRGPHQHRAGRQGRGWRWPRRRRSRRRRRRACSSRRSR